MRSFNALGALMIGAACAAAAGEVRTEPIEFKDGGVSCRGWIAYDDTAKDKRPGVLVVHEWWGCNDYAKSRARQLAELGYVAIAVDMYGEGKTTTDPAEAGQCASTVRKDLAQLRSRINGWHDVMKDRPEVDPARTAAIGYCFGGSTVLELARSGADVDAVVSFHGALATRMPASPGSVKAKILVCNGEADTFVSAEEKDRFKKEMEAAKASMTFVEYPGAVHSFTNPDAGARGIQGVAYQKEADEKSWEAMKAMFKEVCGK